MSTLIEQYNRLYQRIRVLDEQIRALEAQAESGLSESEVGARVAKLEAQIRKIDDFLPRVIAFQRLAEKNLESQNVLTIDAPPDHRVNLNRLRQWAMMIDPVSSNDPYAQRVYAVAKCDELFLQKKKREFRHRIEQLQGREADRRESEALLRKEKLAGLRTELAGIAVSQAVTDFAGSVKTANNSYWYSSSPDHYANPRRSAPLLSPGAYVEPFRFPEEQRLLLKNILGPFYDAEEGRILLPLELSTRKEFAMAVQCTAGRTSELDRALQNLMLNVIERYPAGKNRVYILDGVRFNSTPIARLRELENSFALAPVPRNAEQLTETLEQIVSSFADLEDVLERHDSVAQYNAEAGGGNLLPRMTLFIYGWPYAFSGQDKEYLTRILTNYERYGVSFVTVSYRAGREREEDGTGLPEYAAMNAVKIRMAPKETLVRLGDSAEHRFAWFSLREPVSAGYAGTLRSNAVEKSTLGSQYPRRPSWQRPVAYQRGYRKLELPFGIDGKDQEHCLSFENENFAAYLVGASRSGKSTLLHTLIAGIVRNYHPDNVELWLADFKQLEFKKYFRHLPPHVRCILLDESPELVFDLIDRLTDKMMERQRIFARLGKEKLDQIDPTELDEPMPVIFVMLDEFSIMSQAVAESQTYRLRLQNLLAKGAALGIRFLFASQTFTSGVTGLTPTARAQIQQRIAMKGSRAEISETLELTQNQRTEKINNWMEALPPHYALVKQRSDADRLPEVKRVLVLYFPDYRVRDNMIDELNRRMRPVERYQPGDLNTYVDKHPVLVDGNSYSAFSPKLFLEQLRAEKRDSDRYFGDETFLALGVPRLMVPVKMIALSEETRENLLLIGRSSEQFCVGSVVCSAMREFLLQGRRVQVWAHGKNSCYQTCRREEWNRAEYSGVSFSEGLDRVCDSIRALRERIRRREHGGELIVLLGIDRLAADFEYVDEGASGLQPSALPRSKPNPKALAGSREEAALADKAARWVGRSMQLEREARERGLSQEEIAALLERAEAAFFAAPEEDTPQETAGPASGTSFASFAAKLASLGTKSDSGGPEFPAPPAPETGQAAGAYNATEDLRYILMQGSRLGYHFLMLLNNYSDLKPTGFKLDWFRHRAAFQLSREDALEFFGARNASQLPEHVCQYGDGLNRHSFRPYLHQNLCWDGWAVDERGEAVDPFTNPDPD